MADNRLKENADKMVSALAGMTSYLNEMKEEFTKTASQEDREKIEKALKDADLNGKMGKLSEEISLFKDRLKGK